MSQKDSDKAIDRRKFVGLSMASAVATLGLARNSFGDEAPRPAEVTDDILKEVEAAIANSTASSCVDIELTNRQLRNSVENAIETNVLNVPPDDDPAAQGVQRSLESISGAALDGPADRQLEGLANMRKLWGSGTVTWCFLETPPSALGQACEAAVDQWSKLTCLKLQKVAATNGANIRVSFRPGNGHYSLIGTDSKVLAFSPNRSGSRESMNISPGNPAEYTRVALHEFGHAMGMLHEHQHPDGIKWDKPKVIAHFWITQRWSAEKTRRNVIDRVHARDGFVASTLRDKASIMHYWFPSHLYSVDPGGPGVPDTPPAGISSDDMTFVRKQYACGAIIPPDPTKPIEPEPDPKTSMPVKSEATELTVLTSPDEGVDAKIATSGEMDLYKFEVKQSGKTHVMETYENDPAIAMKLSLYDSEYPEGLIEKDELFGGAAILNSGIEKELDKGTYYVLAEHYHKTKSSVGDYKIRVRAK